MFGRVTKYDNNRGYVLILGEDGNTYFIHRSKLYGEKIDRGYYVFFKPFRNDRSDYNAKCVNVIEVPESNNNHKKKKKTVANDNIYDNLWFVLHHGRTQFLICSSA